MSREYILVQEGVEADYSHKKPDLIRSLIPILVLFIVGSYFNVGNILVTALFILYNLSHKEAFRYVFLSPVVVGAAGLLVTLIMA